MTAFEHEDKLVWQLQEIRGVEAVSLQAQDDLGTFRVDVTVAAGEVDAVWDDLVHQIDSFERALGGEVGLDLEVSTH